MKAAEYVKSLDGKDAAQLNEELAALRKEQFNLRMQLSTGQLNQNHPDDAARDGCARPQRCVPHPS